MRTQFLLCLLTAGIAPLAAAQSRPASRPASKPAKKIVFHEDANGRYRVFGAKLARLVVPKKGERPAVAEVGPGDVAANLARFDGKRVRVTGVVQSTCAKKGCWMWAGGGGGKVFVRFKDYGFFVPTKGAEGKRVVFDGVAEKKTLTVEQARHFAEDAGDLEAAKKITEPVDIIQVMATGVRIYEPAKKKRAESRRAKKKIG